MFHRKRSYQESPGGNKRMKVLPLYREQRNDVVFRRFPTDV